jgi:ketosteroid isomerase-like protein
MAATPRENAALVRRFLTDVVAGGDTDAVDGFLAEDVTASNPVFRPVSGHEPVTALGWRVLAAADIDVVIDDTVATADRVAVRATVTGTHRESLMDLAPTGRSFEIAYAWFCHVENGRITAIHSLPDGLGLLRQLGAIPDGTADRSPTRPTKRGP